MKTQQELDSERIAAAIEFLILHRTSHTGLGDVADHVHLSPCHFQRMFQRRVGVSPKQFARFLSVEYAKKILTETRASLFDAASEAGLSTTSRLHDLFVTIEGMTPGEYKRGGASLEIGYSFAPTPFGEVIVASTPKGICHLTFADEGRDEAFERLRSLFPNASYHRGTDPNQQRALSIFGRDWSDTEAVRLHLKGTAFQLKIWNALLQIPSGGLTTYSDLAQKAGYEGASVRSARRSETIPSCFSFPATGSSRPRASSATTATDRRAKTPSSAGRRPGGNRTGGAESRLPMQSGHRYRTDI